jgi:hypothetical protein
MLCPIRDPSNEKAAFAFRRRLSPDESGSAHITYKPLSYYEDIRRFVNIYVRLLRIPQLGRHGSRKADASSDTK